ncbi:MAG TPA: 30S ribosomal protein S8 [Dehalococcoidia bacterium]|nr:30S ribosomal protein S8 [Dehalococcoidia bacterium]
MTLTDPIADMLTRIRNAVMARHDSVLVPVSKTRLAIAKILKEEGFIQDYEVLRARPQRMLKIHLKYKDHKQPLISGLKRVSKPGLRVYVKSRGVPRVYGGLGVAILSTPQGVMTGQQARRRNVGGELLCYVW